MSDNSGIDSDPPLLSGGRMIIVDDEPHLLDAMTALMTSWGFEVQPFNSFESARATVMHAEVDILLVDIRLGMSNGLHLAHLTRHLHPDTKIIVMSGFDDPLLRAEAARIGAVFLAKPIEPEQLLKEVRTVSRRTN